jgi:uncharacterized protein (DUF433 family)
MNRARTAAEQADWRERIAVPETGPAGKAVVRGPGVEVVAIVRALGAGRSLAELLRDYPGLEEADVAACLAFAASCLMGDADSPGQAVQAPALKEEAGPAKQAEDKNTPSQDWPTLAPSGSPEAVTLSPGREEAVSLPEIPGYEIAEEIGRGGMGVVYRGRQISLNRVVALKMLLGGSGAGSAMLSRFRLEAEAVARLQHPGIVQIHEVGEHGGQPYFSLEYVAGGSLALKLDGTPLPAGKAAALVERLAIAVQHAHGHGIVHRDLKPANVLLAPREQEGAAADEGTSWGRFEPKIADFGLAKFLEVDRGQTRSGDVLGTPGYLAPEQAAGRGKAIGPACDIYALGAILYELLTGRPPFRGENPLETLLQVLDQEPVPVRQVNPQVPRDLETICLKCLRKEPGQRYASATALADDLRRFQAGESIKARPPGVVEKGNRWLRGHPLLAVAYVLAAGGAFLAWLVFGVSFKEVLGVERVNPRGVVFGVMPLTLAVMIAFLRAAPRALLGTLGLLVVGGGYWWYAVWDGRLDEETGHRAVGAVAAVGAVGIVLGLLLRNWRAALLWQLPVLAAATIAGWSVNGTMQPILAGVFHGILLGALSRVVAWGLNREPAAAVLGTLLGAGMGIMLAETYDTRIYGLLLDSGLGTWRRAILPYLSLYSECFVAYLFAVLLTLVLGTRRKERPASA